MTDTQAALMSIAAIAVIVSRHPCRGRTRLVDAAHGKRTPTPLSPWTRSHVCELPPLSDDRAGRGRQRLQE